MEEEVGLILQAYYEMEEVRGKLRKAEVDEETCEEITDRIHSLEKEKELRTAEKEEFSGVRTALKTRRILLEKLTDQTERIREMEKVYRNGPSFQTDRTGTSLEGTEKSGLHSCGSMSRRIGSVSTGRLQQTDCSR